LKLSFDIFKTFLFQSKSETLESPSLPEARMAHNDPKTDLSRKAPFTDPKKREKEADISTNMDSENGGNKASKDEAEEAQGEAETEVTSGGADPERLEAEAEEEHREDQWRQPGKSYAYHQ